MSVRERLQDCVSEAVKCGPVVGAGVSQSFYDVTLPHLLNILLVIYTACQLCFLLWKWRKAAKDKE